ncbi:outer membrane beta-barrel protein [Pusillimonas sp. MFBS29]|uniref:outer membrane protein n=1 Tax=Pusillimonas sp. MFBS29 TaxID=2886690 RepID=UPI001D0F6636|nr:outer membrane beta-barrel protein [Pusillimonas sp. MFBS29]MCC2595220.1 outer membrane beta-barrel protein [Pusillimonas sp. MFBS29]
MRQLIVAVILCTLGATPGMAQKVADDAGPYFGAFGGLGAVSSASMQQKGAVHLNQHFSLPINARGATDDGHAHMAGLQAGYEWSPWGPASANWGVKPAAELEGFYIGRHTSVGELPVMPRFLGTQYVYFPMSAGVVLANAVFTFKTPYSHKIFPYLGIGAGAAFTSVKGSDSANPLEPGINHFNSDPDASDTAFAMQLKVGVKGQLSKNLYLFTEYRYLSISSTSYTFGATDYPGLHLPTASWHVGLGRQHYNFVVAGLQYKF